MKINLVIYHLRILLEKSGFETEEKFFKQWLDNIHARSEEIVSKIEDRFYCQIEEEDGLGECGCTYVYTDEEIKDVFRNCFYQKIDYE